jgi:hypothetical protein
MMSNDERTILKKVCFSVFENLAFMFGDELEEDEVESDDDLFLRASMEFKGPKQGRVALVVPRTLTGLLASNILGLDDEAFVDESVAVDALMELLNTITGRLMTSLFGEDAVVDLSIPYTDELDFTSWEALIAGQEYLAVTIDESPVLITMQTN